VLQEVIVVPRNGLGNRLQAWSSAKLLAEDLGVPLRLMWEGYKKFPVDFHDLFLPTYSQSIMTREELDQRIGIPHQVLPRYLSVDLKRSLIVLAGHDRGEQVFMSKLRDVIWGPSSAETLLIVAGGLFCMNLGEPDGEHDFAARRREFYKTLNWSEEISVKALRNAPAEAYCGLHTRLTDRSNEAPRSRSYTSALKRLREVSTADRLFVAGDTQQQKEIWTEKCRKVGFIPWSLPFSEHSRTTSAGVLNAVAEWLALSNARGGIVHPERSTFSSEAAVAAGCNVVALPPPHPVRIRRRVRRFTRSLIN